MSEKFSFSAGRACVSVAAVVSLVLAVGWVVRAFFPDVLPAEY
ncbi:MAG: hypothetical protein ACOH1J_05480 [Microbacteriaceae bacterium]